MSMSQRFRAALLITATAGCTGVIGDGSTSDITGGGPADGVGEAGLRSELALRRLSRAEYQATLADIVLELVPSSATAINGVLAAVTADLPADLNVGVPGEKHGGFYRLDQAVQQSHVDAGYQVALKLGKELTASPARMTEALGACATDADTNNDTACLDTFIGRLGLLALRRPLTADDTNFFRTRYIGAEGISAASVTDLVAGVLSSPRFFYLVENGEASVSGDIYRLDSYESLLANQARCGAFGRCASGTIERCSRLECSR
jgi:hypothetical protein